MAERIKLVQNDNRPYITLTLTDPATGSAINLTGATVVVYFRAAGSSTVLATLSTSITNAAGGVCRFNFPGSTLNVDAGAYEGEVEITFPGGDVQTVYDLLKFTVREQAG